MHIRRSIIFLFIISALQFTNLSGLTPLDFMNNFTLIYADENMHSKAEFIAETYNRINCFSRLESDKFYQKFLLKLAVNWIQSDSLNKADKTALHAEIYAKFGLYNYKNRQKLEAILWNAIELIETDYFNQALSSTLEDAMPSARREITEKKLADRRAYCAEGIAEGARILHPTTFSDQLNYDYDAFIEAAIESNPGVFSSAVDRFRK